MAMMDRFKVWAARQLVKGAGAVWMPQWAVSGFFQPTFQRLAAEGFRANSVVFACASTLAFSFAEPKLMTWAQGDKGRQMLPKHPATQLLQRPNNRMGHADLLRHVMLYTSIGGNCYIHKVRSQAKRVVELWPYNDGVITPIQGHGPWVDHYEYEDVTGETKDIPIEDIIHIQWIPDPLYPWKGLSPIIACAREVDTDNEATRYLFALLKNDAIPRLAISRDKDTLPLTPDEFQRQKQQWADRQGGENRGGVALLEPGMSIQIVGLDLQQLAFEALRRVPEARLTAAMRVPAVLTGLNVGLEQMTYNNVTGMRKYFTESTMVSLWRMFEDALTAGLLSEFGGGEVGGEVIAFDLSSVIALREGAAEKRQWVDAAVRGGYLTVNEARTEMGLPSVKDGDVFLRTMAQLPEPVEFAGY